MTDSQYLYLDVLVAFYPALLCKLPSNTLKYFCVHCNYIMGIFENNIDLLLTSRRVWWIWPVEMAESLRNNERGPVRNCLKTVSHRSAFCVSRCQFLHSSFDVAFAVGYIDAYPYLDKVAPPAYLVAIEPILSLVSYIVFQSIIMVGAWISLFQQPW